MKIKPSIADFTLFESIKHKNNLTKEGFLTTFFKKRLKNKLDNDTELQQALKDADKELDSLRDYIKKTEKEGRPVPNYVKKYL
jgi:type VI protein secretion system component VasK